jgi:hypothetical protein
VNQNNQQGTDKQGGIDDQHKHGSDNKQAGSHPGGKDQGFDKTGKDQHGQQGDKGRQPGKH